MAEITSTTSLVVEVPGVRKRQNNPFLLLHVAAQSILQNDVSVEEQEMSENPTQSFGGPIQLLAAILYRYIMYFADILDYII